MRKQKFTKLSVVAMTLVLFLIMPFVTANAAPVYGGDTNTDVWYKAHVQDIGWQLDTTNGSTAGTVGMVKNMEAIEIDVHPGASFNIEYTTYVAGKGWTSAVRNGTTSGTVGQNRALTNLCVAIKDKQTNQDSTKYDVYYRVHVRNIGWKGWVKNGYPSSDSANEIEAVEIQIRLKGLGPIETQISAQQKLVNEAYKHLGKPYVYGATGPSTFDCSGLTQYVYRHALGIEIGRTTWDQSKSGRVISSQSQLQPGDLVFTRSDMGHVGLYIGGGKMIHAPQPGRNVEVTTVYAFYTARRII